MRNNRDIGKHRAVSLKGKLPAEYNDEKFKAVREELDTLLRFYNETITFYNEAITFYNNKFSQEDQEKLDALHKAKKNVVDTRDGVAVDLYIVSREVAREQERQEKERKKRSDFAIFASAAAKWFFRSMAFLTNSLKLAGDVIVFLSKSVPPLNAVMLGMVSVVELFEALKVSKEKPNRKVAKIVTSLGAVGFAIPAAVLALQGIAFPAAVLVAFTTSMTVARDVFFIYKTKKDIKKLLDDIAEDKRRGLPVDPVKEAQLKTFSKALRARQNDCISNTFALVGAVFLACAAAAFTVAALNPFALAAIGTTLLGISIAVGARNLYKKHKARQAAIKAESRSEKELAAEHDNFKKKKRIYKKALALASDELRHEYEERQRIKSMARDKLNALSEPAETNYNDVSLILKSLRGSSTGAVEAAKNMIHSCHESTDESPQSNKGQVLVNPKSDEGRTNNNDNDGNNKTPHIVRG